MRDCSSIVQSGTRAVPEPTGRGPVSGSILVGLLWCLALLSLLVVGLLHTVRMDLHVGRHYVDRLQARYLAVAGIEKAKALLYQDARERTRSGTSHSGMLFNAPSHFRDVALGRGTFRVFRGGRAEEGGSVVFGVDDEESRLNANTAAAEDFGRLPGMLAGIPAAILDWRDTDRVVTAGGAEIETYSAQVPPGRPRDGPFQTLREMLMVRGMDVTRFRGDDEHLNDLAGEMEGESEEPGGSGGSGQATAGSGWAGALTVHSGVANVSATGVDRVDVQSASESDLTAIRGITPEIARAIIAHRGQNRFGSLADLLDVGPAPPPGREGAPGSGSGAGGPPGGPGGRPGGPAGSSGGGSGGAKVIDQTLLMDIADSLTTEGGTMQAGVVNVNTASVQTLACLPGISRETAQAIVNHRLSSGYFPNIAALLRVQGVTPEVFKQIAARISARSETFRILAEGRLRESGVRQRVLTVVRIGSDRVETLAYREDDL